jgi:anti-anti-sigma factor
MNSPTTLAIVDDMTIYNAEAQKIRLMQALAESAALALDLTGVNEIDTAGLQLLLLARREAEATGKDMHIASLSSAVQELLAFCNLTPFFAGPDVACKDEQA